MLRPRACAALGCLLGYGAIAVRFSGRAPRAERAVFRWINWNGGSPWLRVPQQWGTPWTLPAVATLALVRRRPSSAVAGLACLAAEKSLEAVTKTVRRRPRPAMVQPTVRRDDAPATGGSLPSGHAAVAACGTVLMSTIAPATVWPLLVPVTLMSAWSRIAQGAHEPIDVVAGLLLGTGVGLAITELTQAVATQVG